MAHTKDIARQLTNVVAIPAGIAAGYVATPEDATIGEVARSIDPMLAAATLTFAIWGFIYLWQIMYAVYQALPSQRERPLFRRIGWLTAANSLLAGFWTIAFTNRLFTIAWLTLLATLGVLIAIDIAFRDEARTGKDYWFARVTYGVNLGWISVATILGTAQWLTAVVEWEGAPLSARVWCYLLVGAATLLAAFMTIMRYNNAFAIAVAWGLLGIAAYRRHDVEPLAIMCAVCTGALTLLTMVEYVVHKIQRTRTLASAESMIGHARERILK